MQPRKISTSHGLTVGDLVRIRGGVMVGRLKSILAGGWTNGEVPMAVVDWPTGSRGRTTISRLETVTNQENP